MTEGQKESLKRLYDQLCSMLEQCEPDAEKLARALQTAPDALGFAGLVNSLQELIFLRWMLHALCDMRTSLSAEHVCFVLTGVKALLEARRSESVILADAADARDDGETGSDGKE